MPRSCAVDGSNDGFSREACSGPDGSRLHHGSLRAFWALAFTAAFAPVERAAQEPAASFVEGCRAALIRGEAGGGKAAQGAGKGTLWGLPGSVRLLVRPGPGYFFEFEGELDIAWALSPRANWELDPTGARWPLEGADAERRLWLALVLSGDWILDPELASAIHVELAEDDGEGELRSARLELEHGVLDVELAVSRSTHLPARLVIADGGMEQTIEFSGWAEGAGRLWPMRVVIDGAATGTVMEFDGFTTPDAKIDPFARESASADATYPPEGAAEVECKRTRSGHLLVHPQVDDRDVGWFLFDSGAGRLALDGRALAELGLATFGRRTMLGASGEVEVPFARGRSLRLGAFALAHPLFTRLDCTPVSRACGTEVVGLIGADVFRRAVVEIDRAAPAIRIFAPSSYPSGELPWTPLHFNLQLACIDARFEGERSGLFRLDTGSDLPLLFHGPAVHELDLLAGRTVRAVGSSGIGGGFRGQLGELAWIEFGGLRRERVPTMFADAESVALSTRATLGILGAGAFADERVVFDYPAGRVAFVPRGR